MADSLEVDMRRYRVEIHPKTGEHAVKDTVTGELLDISDCCKLLNLSVISRLVVDG
jgi:hypothetical protein